MDMLQVFLFGKFHIQYANQKLEGLSAAKAQELFCYLLLNSNRPFHRETLATVLWSDVTTNQSKQYLRRTLWQLQNVFSGWDVLQNDELIFVEGDWIQFNSQASLWVDTKCFEEKYRFTLGISGKRLNGEGAKQLCDAIQIYQDNLLIGWYQDWCLFERERFQQMFLSALDKLMLYCEVCGKYEMGIEYGTRILRYDKAREHTHRRLMRLYCLSGNRTSALRQYEQCKTILNNELGIKPAKVTSELYKQICTPQQETPLPIKTVNNGRLSPKYNYLQKEQRELQQIYGVLTSMQKQLQQQIELVESLLNTQG
jgi:DNA-binding SARP family transcriptional activator